VEKGLPKGARLHQGGLRRHQSKELKNHNALTWIQRSHRKREGTVSLRDKKGKFFFQTFQKKRDGGKKPGQEGDDPGPEKRETT